MNTLVGLLAFAICAAPIPKAVKPPEPTKEQLKHAEKKIGELGGWCHFIPVSNDELAANHFVLQKQVTPEVLEKLDFLTFRCSLQLHDSCGITDDTLAEIVRRVPYIDRLELHSPHITSKGLEELPKLGRLQSLQIQCPKIDDDAMNSISKLENLEFLWLEECPITDVGIKLIASNTRLTCLRLKDVDFTGGHLQVLKKLPLEWLVVENISYANDLLPILLEIKSLKSLKISGSSLDDEGARQLGKLKSLVVHCS